MKESFEDLEVHLDDPEFRHAYAASFMNACVAAQIKIIREQRGLTQAQLAEKIGTKQAGISRLENINYDAWKVETLARIASAYDVWLRISFEEFDSLTDEIERYGRATLERESYGQVKKRISRRHKGAAPVSEKLLEALSPADARLRRDKTEIQKKDVDNASQIGAAGKGFRIPATGRNDPRNESLPPELSGLSGGEMPLPEEAVA
jgi:transcriptional regulator with XRE-family HTH domain